MLCTGAEMQNGERRLRHKKEKEYGYMWYERKNVQLSEASLIQY